MVESAPQLSKRCRALIKCWQKLADPRPTSSCGSHSNSATPNLVSPVVRRGLTPGTPARGRLTSAALSTGRFAKQFNISGGEFTKWQLCATAQPVLTSQWSSATGPHSVIAARRANVQPTSELVAQLSENLPRYMAINLSERESQLKREQDQQSQTIDERQSIASEGTTSNTVTVPTRDGRFEWSAILPTLDTLRHREEFKATQSDDPSKSYVVSVHGRKVPRISYF
uniref:TFIIS N-terminal domain-containing protein n=1 Tax=Parascaris equorum TaxID=6256 RepID=A0A914S6J3_PAREQ